MDDGRPIDRRNGWDRRGLGERRRNSDRRCQPDRRGNPSAKSETSDEPRPYAFRSFDERRGSADRRQCAANGDRRQNDERRDGIVWRGEADVELTPEEVLALLHYRDDEKD